MVDARIQGGLFALGLLVEPGGSASSATLTVGPGQTYGTIASAVAAARAGDLVQVTAGTYTDDFPEIIQPITLAAIGGRVVMKATGDIPNGKAILITDTDATVTGFDFTGARVSDANGAGIRYQGGNLVLNDCWFHGNQEGLLADSVPAGTLQINASEFSGNGIASGPNAGYTHNLYVGQIALLKVEDSFFTNAHVGHEIKSRAAQTIIDRTRIYDGLTGTASYSVDLPNGGRATITGSEIEQGPKSDNPVIVAFGEEGNLWASTSLSVQSSVLVNEYHAHIPIGVMNTTQAIVTLAGDHVWGLTPAQYVTGPASVGGIVRLSARPPMPTGAPWAK